MPHELSAETQAVLEHDETELESFGYQNQGLRRVLGGFSNFALQYSTIAVVGGMFVVYPGSFQLVGSAIIWPWIVAGGLQMLVALCVAEGCSAFPLAGGAYNVVSRLSTRSLGWMTAWVVMIAHIASVTASMYGIAPYVASWFGWSTDRWPLIWMSIGLIVVALIVNLLGVRFASIVNNLGVGTELVAAFVATIVFGAVLFFGAVHHNSLSVLFDTQGTVHGSLVLPLLFAILVPCFVINGFDVSGTASEETMNASTVVPRGMMFANVSAWVIGGVMIILLNVAMTDPAGALGSASPFRFIMTPVLGSTVAAGFEVLAVFSLWVSGVVLLLAGTRVLYAMARDNEVPAGRFLMKVNHEGVPLNGAIASTVLAILILFWTPLLDVLLATITILWTLSSVALIGAVYMHRRKGTFNYGPFRVRLGGLVYPVAFVWTVISCGILIYQDPAHVGVGTVGVVILGVVLFAAYQPFRNRQLARTVVELPTDQRDSTIAGEAV